MSTHHDVSDLIDNTAQLEGSRFRGDRVIAEAVMMWYEVSSITNGKHITNATLQKTTDHETAVHTRKQYSDGLQIDNINYNMAPNPGTAHQNMARMHTY